VDEIHLEMASREFSEIELLAEVVKIKDEAVSYDGLEERLK